MKRLKTVVIAGILAVGLNIGEASAAGNGNDGCQIGNIPGHKDHGQSNEHKIDYMTKTEWEAYLIANNIIAEQMSNNDGSNGWITYHIYNAEGKQIEVVHIRFKKEEVPPVTEPEVPEEKPERPEVPEEKPPVEDTDIPMTPLEPALPSEPVEPEAPEEIPEDKEEIPMVPLEPSIPTEKPEDSIPMLPLEPSEPIETPEVPEEDIEEDEEIKDDQDNIEDDTEEVPSVGDESEDEVVCPDDDMFEDWTDEEESIDNNTINRIENPKTGDIGLLGYVTTSIMSLSGLLVTRRNR